MGSSPWHPISITWGDEDFSVAVDSEIIFMPCFSYVALRDIGKYLVQRCEFSEVTSS